MVTCASWAEITRKGVGPSQQEEPTDFSLAD
jgi:hypothetical protein